MVSGGGGKREIYTPMGQTEGQCTGPLLGQRRSKTPSNSTVTESQRSRPKNPMRQARHKEQNTHQRVFPAESTKKQKKFEKV